MKKLTNEPGQNEQIVVFADQPAVREGELRWSKFYNAACRVHDGLHGIVGLGDQINILEGALQAAYTKGYHDAIVESEK